MPARAHWKGYLKLSLVSCPIALYPAISAAERVSFRQVNRQTGNRLRHQLVDSVTGDVVTPEQKGRGYEAAERQLILVQDDELEAAQQQARTRPFSAAPHSKAETGPRAEAPQPISRREGVRRAEVKRPAVHEEAAAVEPVTAPVRVHNTRTIEIERCVPRAQIDPRYHDTPYYITPRDETGQEAFAVLREALRVKEMAGMGRVVLAKRERPIVVEPLGNGLCGMTLRYANEVRNEAEYFASLPDLTLPEEMLEVAEHILEMKASDFDPALLEDRYRTVLISMLKDKQAELPMVPESPRRSPTNVINLMEALRRSLETERPVASPKARRGTAKPASRRASASRKR